MRTGIGVRPDETPSASISAWRLTYRREAVSTKTLELQSVSERLDCLEGNPRNGFKPETTVTFRGQRH